ncbi:MAG: dihydropteroate synthase [Spirochaetales bacterium]
MFSCAPPLSLANRILKTELPAFVMTIVNCTPDSFWEKSRFAGSNSDRISKTTEYILEQFAKGSDIVDIGGESTRPGAHYIDEDEESERIIPVIQAVRKYSSGVISVDTRKSSVLKEAIKAGADILNDVSALEDDNAMAKCVAGHKIPVILMHKRGSPLIMQEKIVYNDIIESLGFYLNNRVRYAVCEGIEPQKIILDGGIGFAKDTKANIRIVTSSRDIEQKIENQNVYGMLVGLSRKTFIGEITGKHVEDRLAGTLSANMLAVQHGAKILRVHDSEETIDMLKILKEIG